MQFSHLVWSLYNDDVDHDHDDHDLDHDDVDVDSPPLANRPPQITRRSSHLSLRHDFFPCEGFVPRHLLCPPAILKILTRMPRPTNLCDPRLNQIEEIEIE